MIMIIMIISTTCGKVSCLIIIIIMIIILIMILIIMHPVPWRESTASEKLQPLQVGNQF